MACKRSSRNEKCSTSSPNSLAISLARALASKSVSAMSSLVATRNVASDTENVDPSKSAISFSRNALPCSYRSRANRFDASICSMPKSTISSPLENRNKPTCKFRSNLNIEIPSFWSQKRKSRGQDSNLQSLCQRCNFQSVFANFTTTAKAAGDWEPAAIGCRLAPRKGGNPCTIGPCSGPSLSTSSASTSG